MNWKIITDAQLCKSVRKKMGLTQRGLGIKLGYKSDSASVSINKVEGGKKQLPLSKWKLLKMYAGESVPDNRS